MDITIRRRRNALCVFFLLLGVSLASWVTRTPAIRDELGVSIAEMGTVLFGLSAGSMIGILGSGWLVGRHGTRAVTRLGLWLAVASLVVIGLGTLLASSLFVAFGLFLFGLGVGPSEIAINVDGAAVEIITETHLLHFLHGFFSLGTVVGTLAGIAAMAIGLPVVIHLMIVAVVSAIPIIALIGRLPVDASQEKAGEAHETAPSSSVMRDWRLYLIGLVVLAMALAEGSANDWLPLLMVDDFNFDPTSSSMIFLGFAIAMTAGRFGGGVFLKHFGRAKVLAGSALISGVGVAIIIFGHDIWFVLPAVVLWGLGASLGFPVALSAAGASGPNSDERVKLVAICGYIAFLVGPPMLGFLGEHYGLRNAMMVVLGLIMTAVVASCGIRRDEAPQTSTAKSGGL